MPARLHPGVYVEEVPSAARAIEAAGTSTAIFVGETERGPLEPIRIVGRADFERLFGGYRRHASAGGSQIVSLAYSIDAFFQNGGSTAYVLRAVSSTATAAGYTPSGHTSPLVVASSPGAWGNNLYSVLLTSTSSSAESPRFRIIVFYKAPGSNQPKAVENWDRLSTDGGDENYVADVLQRSLYIRWASPSATVATSLLLAGESAITDTTRNQYALQTGAGGDVDLAVSDFGKLLEGLDGVSDAALLVVPARIYDSDDSNRLLQQAALSYAEARPQQDLFCIADMPRQSSEKTASDATNKTVTAFGNLSPKTTLGAIYFPWLEISDPMGVGRDPVLVVPPSGFVAGIYSRTDARRGVWKAPAGLDATLLGLRKVEHKLLDAHQDALNPLGINVIRVQPAAGAVVWGSRTLRPDSEWRYVPVRRTAIFLRKSIYNSIQWAVFEPNDQNLWASLRVTITAFMEQLFRQGAFAGKTTREAFFVKCDEETTPEADQIAGIVNVWVGFAPLRPAEFVVVKLSQIVNQKA
ncbi:phage tail sheath family protein [Cystobacter ferrugineus]|uniref:Phage tail protein n=1 Tax=Cystobacter ferrugineus TaxID=83449 RepID=A0A1L9AX56_9BACT|nr:phage tail sheath subtilisin-like domain-containing protein [Cystobacter ferrugineus]OJH34503.1 hypothetical protein BON30_42595 [Cystobacter ferrugineus]